MKDQDLWDCIHIYYQGDLDALLIDCVKPLSATLREKGFASRVFYLRYWRGGPHIRLRFRAAKRGFGDAGLSIACTWVNEYLKNHPSPTVLDAEGYITIEQHLAALEDEFVEVAEFQPNNTCRIETYVREFTKYGGPVGVAIAEDLFDASTKIALQLLPQLARSTQKKLGRAFLMLIVGVLGFGISVDDTPAFFAWNYQVWTRYVSPSNKDLWELSVVEIEGHLEQVTRAILDGTCVLPADLLAWRDAMSTTAGALSAHDDLVLDAIGVEFPAAHKRLFLLINYLHTHNNRLGLVPSEEAFVGYLACKIVQRINAGASTVTTKLTG